MEYEKKYNDALGRAKSFIKRGGEHDRLVMESIFPELKESEDERTWKEIIQFFKDGSNGKTRVTASGTVAKWAEFLEKQKEQKPVEWSEEDYSAYSIILNEYKQMYEGRATSLTRDDVVDGYNFLKSLRPQPHKEIYQAAKHDLAIKFMNYLDENNISDGKTGLSNGEREDIDIAFKENDWAKIMRYYEKYRPHWKPSEEQMAALRNSLDYLSEDDYDDMLELYEQLKKLM
jgi:hypothetical protein